MNNPSVIVILGFSAHSTDILAVCDSEDTANNWLDNNPDIYDMGYACVATYEHTVITK